MRKLRPYILFFLLIIVTACAIVQAHPVDTPTAAAPSAIAPRQTALASPPALTSPSPTSLPPTLTLTPPGPTPTPAPTAKPFLDEYLPRRVKVAESAHFIFYAQDNFFPVDQAWWVEQAEQAYSYISQRLNGAQVKHKISIGFLPPEKRDCPVRGLASHDKEPIVLIYADATYPRAYLLGVMAHEVGHAISYEFPEGLPRATVLAEGLATYAAADYWAAWKNAASIDDIVRGYLNAGEYEPISQNVDMHGVYPWDKNTGDSQTCLARRDKLYTEWASFTGYLIDTYGWEKAHALFQSNTGAANTWAEASTATPEPDYVKVYGLSLEQLEQNWLAAIRH